MMRDHDLQVMVGDDLLAIVRDLALPVTAVTRISPLRSPSWPRAVFRLDLGDGRSAKGRQLETVAAAKRAALLSRCLPAGSFPRVIAQCGSAIVSDWIDGEVLSSCPVESDHARRIGAIQRSVHTIVVPSNVPDAPDRYPTGNWRRYLDQRVEWLCERGHLEPGDGMRTMALVDAYVPPVRPVRLVHGDICPENIVLAPGGSLYVVDNDTIDLHVPEFDLARTWYRWPMAVAERKVFEEGYAGRDVLASYRAHFLHWAMVVLVGAAEFRLRRQLSGADEPLARLRGLLGRGAIYRLRDDH
jgi:aminoglycoside phosphotransferase (APT) family kinase protein